MEPGVSVIGHLIDEDRSQSEGMGADTGINIIERESIDDELLTRDLVYIFSGPALDTGMVKTLLGELDTGFDIVAGAYLSGGMTPFTDGSLSPCIAICTQKGMNALKGQKPITVEAVRQAASTGLRVKVVEDARMLLHRIGVVVPAYNEERLIGDTLRSIPPYISRVYAVDDGSRDRTSDVIESIDDSRVVHIRHYRNKGVGAAIISGYKQAMADGMDIIAVMAGDGQMDPRELPKLLTPLMEGRADYLKGNRLQTKGHRKGMRPWRLFGNMMLSMLNKVASGYWHVNDPQNGYTAITREALEAIDPDSIYTYYGYCNDMLVRLNAAGMRVEDVSMPSRYGSERSSIKYVPYIIKVSSLLLRDFLWRLVTKYVLLDFHPLVLFYVAGFALLLAGMLAIIVSALGMLDPALSLLTLLAALQSILMAMVFDRQATESRRQYR